MSFAIRRGDRLKIVKHASIMLPVAYLSWINIPGAFFPVDRGLDPSYIYGINYLVHSDYGFGKAVVFTYGPLGFILLPLNVGPNLLYALGFRFAVYAIFTATLLWYAWKKGRVLTILVFVVGYILAFFIGLGSEFGLYDYKLFVLICLLLSLSLRGDLNYSVTAPLAGTLAALLIFMKLSTGLSAFFLIVSLGIIFTIKNARHRRPLACVGISYLLTLAVVSLVFFRSPRDFLNWLRGSFSIADGYSAAMSAVGPAWIVFVALICFGIYAALTVLMYRRRSSLRHLLLAFSVPVFFSFKSGFVRQLDGHLSIYFVCLLSVLCVVALNVDDRRELAMLSAGIALVFILALPPLTHVGVLSVEGMVSMVLPGREGWVRLRSLVSLDNVRDRLDAEARSNLQGGILPAEWVELIKRNDSTVDVIPWEISYCPANDLNWQPGPTLQTYSAYTSYLDLLGSRYFSNASAPEFLIVTFGEIDGRHPMWGAPATWQAFLRNYRLVENVTASERLLLLERRERSYTEDWSKVYQDSAHLNQWVPVPYTTNLLFAEIDISLNALGTISKMAYLIPPVTIDIEYASGSRKSYRIIPDTARNGILLNFPPSTGTELRALFQGVSADRAVRFRLSGPGARFFSDRMLLTWKELPFGAEFLSPGYRLADLSLLGTSNLCVVDTVGGRKIGKTRDQSIIINSDREQIVSIDGWAVDHQAKKPAGGLYVNIDGLQDIPAIYGTDRLDVAKHFGNDGVRFSGFYVSLPLSELGKGRHVLTVKIVTNDKKGYFESEKRFILELI